MRNQHLQIHQSQNIQHIARQVAAIGLVSDVSSVKSETASAARWASVFGGKHVDIGPRIDCNGAHCSGVTCDHPRVPIEADEPAADIQYRTCSWRKTAALLFAEYIGLAIMCFPATYTEMGWVGGLLATLLNAALYQYTSLILWEFCLRHPDVRDICDIGRILGGARMAAWWATTAMFVLNNTVRTPCVGESLTVKFVMITRIKSLVV